MPGLLPGEDGFELTFDIVAYYYKKIKGMEIYL